ncbi:MAG: ATP-binding protein [Rhodocyclaceae bacterium]|nr:ATP-binding protein [Rhodocyclaceae bacterium]
MTETTNIADPKATELELRKALEQAQCFNDALDQVGAFVYIRDAHFRFAYANKITLEFFGCAPLRLIGAADTHFFPPETIRQLRALDQRVLAGEEASGEVTIDLPGGSRSFYWVVQSPVYQGNDRETVAGITGIATDITAQRQIEQTLADSLAAQRALNQQLREAQNQLLQSEKLASIGQLAAGVAHEINNPIGFIGSNFGALENYLRDLFAIADAYAEAAAALGPQCPQLEQVHALKHEKDYEFLRTDTFQLLAESKDGLARVAKIVRDLKDFSRVGEAEWQTVDLHTGIDSTLNLVWNELKYKCTVTKDYGMLPPIWCIPSQLNQVFMNLLVNAGHAIADKGEITLRTGQQGEQVSVAISDTGSGIAPENLDRIFDPFFTTQPVGSGTGLGLSLAYGIVQKHQGRIEVQSEVGKGTTFTVWLPIQPAADPADAVPPAPTCLSGH